MIIKLLLSLITLGYFVGDPKRSIHQHNPDSITVTFRIMNAGVETVGTVQVQQTDVLIDPDNLSNSHIHAVADVSTIHTGIQIRDKHLLRSDFFDAKAFPEIVFTATSFTRQGKDILCVGNLTIKGITKAVSMPVKIQRQKKLTIYFATFIINRLEFDVGSPSIVLDDRVVVEISASRVSKLR